jgi:hypothetical protein
MRKMIALTDPRARRVLALVLLAGWTVSLALPALTLNIGRVPDPPILSGRQVLASGWIDLVVLQIGWLANPALLVALALLSRKRPSRRALKITAILLLICTLDTFDLFLRRDFYTMEGAHGGYHLWFAVNLIAALSALFLFPRPTSAIDAETGSA